MSFVTNMLIKWKFGNFSPERGQTIDKCKFTMNKIAMKISVVI